MRRIIKYRVIDECNDYLQKKVMNLKDIKSKLLTDINKIDSFYKGKDATALIEKYQQKANELDIYIDNVEKCIMYLSKIVNDYNNSYTKINNVINEILAINENKSVSDVGVGTLNVNLIN